MRTALTKRESLAHLEKYLLSTLLLVEYLETKKNPEHDSLRRKLYGNCLHLVAVKEKEEYLEHDFLLVFRLWISKLKLRKDRIQGNKLDTEKLSHLVEYIDKVHQKYLPLKISCMIECFCQCFTYHVETQLMVKLVDKFKEVSQAVSTTFGNFRDSKDLLTLKIIAFAKSMEQCNIDQDVLVLAFFFCKAIEVSVEKTKIDEAGETSLNHLLELLDTVAVDARITDKGKSLVKVLLEANQTQVNLWPVLIEPSKDSLHGQKRYGARRYYLKAHAVNEEKIAKEKSDAVLMQKYQEYQSTTRFDIDEIIKQKKLVSQKQNFFKSVERNLYNKWPTERKSLAAHQTLSAVKQIYGDVEEIVQSKDRQSSSRKDSTHKNSACKEIDVKDGQFLVRNTYKPASRVDTVFRKDSASSRSHTGLRGSKDGIGDTIKFMNLNTERDSTSSQARTHRVRRTVKNFGHSEFLLLDSSKGNQTEQLFIK